MGRSSALKQLQRPPLGLLEVQECLHVKRLAVQHDRRQSRLLFLLPCICESTAFGTADATNLPPARVRKQPVARLKLETSKSMTCPLPIGTTYRCFPQHACTKKQKQSTAPRCWQNDALVWAVVLPTSSSRARLRASFRSKNTCT